MASTSYLWFRYSQLREKANHTALTPSERDELERIYSVLCDRNVLGDRR